MLKDLETFLLRGASIWCMFAKKLAWRLAGGRVTRHGTLLGLLM
jgi:hypothetical protein